MRMRTVVLLALVGALAQPVLAEEGTSNLDILIQKVKADKKLLVAANMNLTDEEGKVFWPIYDSYQKDLAAINTRLAKAIKEYADAYNAGAVPDDTAKKLFADAIGAEKAEVDLKDSYLLKLEKVVPMSKAVRYLQIESKIRAALRFELADRIPLVD